MEWSIQQNWRLLVIKTDCLHAVSECLAEEGVLVDSQIFYGFNGCPTVQGIRFVPRRANEPTHAGAGFVARETGDMFG